MALTKKLSIQNVVILANNFNPSIFNQHWLVSNNFLKVDDILPGSVFTADAAQVKTKEAEFLVIPPQLQFASKISEKWKEPLDNMLIRFVDRLSEVPYRAVGLNFVWFASEEGVSINELSKRLFYSDGINLFSDFEGNNAKFGVYASKDFRGSRLRLDIKPATTEDPHDKSVRDVVQLAFNFHKDLTGEKVNEELKSFLQDSVSYKAEADRIMDLIN